jgi:CopG family transcriptional regulator / antitoxin EndoAI
MVCKVAAREGGQIAMHRRINITLPEETLDLIDRVAQPGDRSRFIDEAIKHYIGEIGRGNLRKQLKEGAIRRAQRDLALAEEWFTLDEEAGQGARR